MFFDIFTCTPRNIFRDHEKLYQKSLMFYTLFFLSFFCAVQMIMSLGLCIMSNS